MLERLAPTKALLEKPRNKKMKRFIETSVAANGPLLEKIMGQRAMLGDITLVIDAMFKQNLEFGTRLPKTLLSFSREVADAWDSVSMEERENAGLDPELCKSRTPASSYFSNARRGRNSFDLTLTHAETRRSMIRRWKLLMGLQHKNISFERVQNFFLNEAKESLRLTSFELINDGVSLSGVRIEVNDNTGELEEIPGEIKLVHKNIYPNIVDYEGKLSLLKNEVANRLIVGYSSVLH